MESFSSHVDIGEDFITVTKLLSLPSRTHTQQQQQQTPVFSGSPRVFLLLDDRQSTLITLSLLQWRSQRPRRHHLHQQPEDLNSDRRQHRHQAGRNPECGGAPRERGRYPHCCSH